MIIGLSGYARSGKDTVAKELITSYGFTRIAFADKIRTMLSDINPILEDGHRLNEVLREFGWDLVKARSEVRRLLQELGVAARKNIDPDVWVTAAIKDIPNNDNVVITDVRFINEAVTIKHMGGEIWRVNRPGFSPVNGHESETQLDNYPFDRVINNDSDIQNLKDQLSDIMVSQ